MRFASGAWRRRSWGRRLAPPRRLVLVFTGSAQGDGRRFYMHFGRAVWNNDGDVAVLTDRAGRVVARYAY